MLTRAQAAEFVTEPHDEDSFSALSDAAGFLSSALDSVNDAIDELDRIRKFQNNAAVVEKITALMLALDAARAASPLWDIADEQAREIKRASGRFEIGDDDGRPGSARLSYLSQL
jgi:hypothetical protein